MGLGERQWAVEAGPRRVMMFCDLLRGGAVAGLARLGLLVGLYLALASGGGMLRWSPVGSAQIWCPDDDDGAG